MGEQRPDIDLRYRSLFDQHPHAVFELDLDGHFVAGNAALEQLTGYSLAELLAMDFTPLIHDSDRSAVAAQFARAARGEVCQYRARGRYRDGRVRGFSVTNMPIVVDDEVVGVYGVARDITAELAAQAALEDSERRFRGIFEGSATGIFVVDLDGLVLQANPAFSQMLGLSEEQLLGQDIWQIIHPDDRSAGQHLARALVQGRRDRLVVEPRYLTSSGDVAWGRTTITLVRSADGEPKHPICIVEDVTERKRAEQRARDSEALLRIAGSVARLGGWAVDADTRQNHWSEEMRDILEFPSDRTPELAEIIEYYPVEQRGMILSALESCLSDGTPFDLDAQVTTHRGGQRSVRLVGHAERGSDGRIIAARGALQDVTEQHEAATRHKRVTAQLSRTLEAISDGVGTLDSDWTITYANRQAAVLLGRPQDQLVGRHLLEAYPELEGSPLHESYVTAMEQRVPTTVDPFYFPELRAWFEVRAYPSDPGIGIYFRDVTERVDRERRLQQIAEAELRAADQLRELDHVKNTFLTAVSHELRTPLTVVQGLAQTLQRIRGNADDAIRERIEDALVNHADRLASLLQDLLDLDRLARGAVTSQHDETDIVALVHEVVENNPAAERIELTAPDSLIVHVDRIQIERIVGNLLDNAAKYADNGAITVTVAAGEPDGLRLDIIDEGPGIPDTQLEQIFEPFHRAREVGPKPGTGIGLALVAEFAKLHGGRAWAQSCDSGAHLVVEIPNRP